MYNKSSLALGLVYLRSPGGRLTVLFCYYLLGGDTAAPSGLYAIMIIIELDNTDACLGLFRLHVRDILLSQVEL